MKLIQKQAPAAEPVYLDDAKQHLRVDMDYDDGLITGLISAAREMAEKFTQRSFITQSWYLFLDYHPDHGLLPPLLRDRNPNRNKIRLPMPPLQSVDAFEYQATAGTWTAVDASLYYVDLPGSQIVLTPCEGTVAFPSPAVEESAFRVSFTAGYGTMPAEAEGTAAQAANPVPFLIQQGIKTFVLHMYENREAYAAGKMEAVPAAGESLLMPFKVMDY